MYVNQHLNLLSMLTTVGTSGWGAEDVNSSPKTWYADTSFA